MAAVTSRAKQQQGPHNPTTATSMKTSLKNSLLILSLIPRGSVKVPRLDCLGGYLPCLSINYVAKSKDMDKGLPQLYYIKMKVSYDLSFIAIGVAMAT